MEAEIEINPPQGWRWALEQMKAGNRVRRESWAPGRFVCRAGCEADGYSGIVVPGSPIECCDGIKRLWTPEPDDIRTVDWSVAGDGVTVCKTPTIYEPAAAYYVDDGSQVSKIEGAAAGEHPDEPPAGELGSSSDDEITES